MKIRYRNPAVSLMIVLLAGSLLCGGVMADTPDPLPDAQETWIRISGTAVNAAQDGFTLDYGSGRILVEMDTWQWYEKGFQALENHKVTVYGRMDDDLYETGSIEARSVYDQNLGTYFYAGASDETFDDDYDLWITGLPVIPGQITVRGTVSSVSGREFTIDTGSRMLVVDRLKMTANPVYKEGFEPLKKGDRVNVTGSLDHDFWEGREIMARSVIRLKND